MSAAIRVENLSKRYYCGTRSSAYSTLRETVVESARWAWASLSGQRVERAERGEFWALKDVSFEIQPGEVVGIIGRNGAGKSTLLKILSRIVEPTSGRVRVRGRMGSLLEVGTGFHPELTGRENIYLNGAILGMKRSEITRKFDEIVAFSEIEQFLDTPVKRYSSGMYVRLAFAVAAHLEPEILVVDEVLAVGDAAFQAKCLRKMENVARVGRTVVFVSHNVMSLQALCTRGVVIEHGQVAVNDAIEPAVEYYLRGLESRSAVDLTARTDRSGDGRARLGRIRVSAGETANGSLRVGSRAVIQLWITHSLPGLTCVFTIYNQHGQPVATFQSKGQLTLPTHGSGSLVISCQLEEVLLLPGRYRVNAALFIDGERADHVEGATTFTVLEGTVRGLPVCSSSFGQIYLPHQWEVRSTEAIDNAPNAMVTSA